MTSALDGGGWSTSRPGRLSPRKDSVPIVQEAGWAPGPVWIGAGNLAPPPPGFDPQTVWRCRIFLAELYLIKGQTTKRRRSATDGVVHKADDTCSAMCCPFLPTLLSHKAILAKCYSYWILKCDSWKDICYVLSLEGPWWRSALHHIVKVA